MEISSRYDPKKLLLLLAAAWVLTAAGVWMLLCVPDLSLKATVAGWVGVVFFGGFGNAALLPRFFQHGEVLHIDSHGIYDRRITDRPIPWSAIADITEMSIRRTTFFTVRLSQPLKGFVDSGLKRRCQSLNGLFGFQAVNLSASGLDISTKRLREALAHYRPPQGPRATTSVRP